MRPEVSIDFSSQEFSVNSSTVPYNMATSDQNKKEIVFAQNLINAADDEDDYETHKMLDRPL